MQKRTEDGKTLWVMSAWWDKVVYVCGWIFVAMFVLGFLKGFWTALPTNAGTTDLFTVSRDLANGYTKN